MAFADTITIFEVRNGAGYLFYLVICPQRKMLLIYDALQKAFSRWFQNTEGVYIFVADFAVRNESGRG